MTLGLMSIVVFVLSSSCSNCLSELIHTFMKKDGTPIADMYACYESKPILNSLTITRITGDRIDTLYKVVPGKLIGVEGVEAEFDIKKFKGLKVEAMHKGSVVLVLVDDSGKGVSDFMTISWNDTKARFELIKSP